MKHLLRNKHFYWMVLIDAALVVAAYILAYLLRFEGSIPQYQISNLQKTLPLLIPIKLIVFYFFQLYRGMWRYTSILDIKNVILASTASSISNSASCKNSSCSIISPWLYRHRAPRCRSVRRSAPW